MPITYIKRGLYTMNRRFINKLRPEDKINILTAGRFCKLNNHLCGEYIRLCGEDIFWDIDARKYNYNLLAYTSKGIVKHKYNFNFTFNNNLCELVDKIYDKFGGYYNEE